MWCWLNCGLLAKFSAAKIWLQLEGDWYPNLWLMARLTLRSLPVKKQRRTLLGESPSAIAIISIFFPLHNLCGNEIAGNFLAHFIFRFLHFVLWGSGNISFSLSFSKHRQHLRTFDFSECIDTHRESISGNTNRIFVTENTRIYWHCHIDFEMFKSNGESLALFYAT